MFQDQICTTTATDHLPISPPPNGEFDAQSSLAPAAPVYPLSNDSIFVSSESHHLQQGPVYYNVLPHPFPSDYLSLPSNSVKHTHPSSVQRYHPYHTTRLSSAPTSSCASLPDSANNILGITDLDERIHALFVPPTALSSEEPLFGRSFDRANLPVAQPPPPPLAFPPHPSEQGIHIAPYDNVSAPSHNSLALTHAVESLVQPVSCATHNHEQITVQYQTGSQSMATYGMLAHAAASPVNTAGQRLSPWSIPRSFPPEQASVHDPAHHSYTTSAPIAQPNHQAFPLPMFDVVSSEVVMLAASASAQATFPPQSLMETPPTGVHAPMYLSPQSQMYNPQLPPGMYSWTPALSTPSLLPPTPENCLPTETLAEGGAFMASGGIESSEGLRMERLDFPQGPDYSAEMEQPYGSAEECGLSDHIVWLPPPALEDDNQDRLPASEYTSRLRNRVPSGASMPRALQGKVLPASKGNGISNFTSEQWEAADAAFQYSADHPGRPIPSNMLGQPLSSVPVIDHGVLRAQCLCCPPEARTLRRLDHLWPHMRKEHFSNGTYSCTIQGCGAMFSRSHDLKRHEKTHESPVYCCLIGDCSAQYSRRDNLRRHVQRKHPRNRLEDAQGLRADCAM